MPSSLRDSMVITEAIFEDAGFDFHDRHQPPFLI